MLYMSLIFASCKIKNNENLKLKRHKNSEYVNSFPYMNLYKNNIVIKIKKKLSFCTKNIH